MKKILFLLAISFITSTVFSQTAGDFQSKASGNWTSTSTWQTYSGSEWQDAATAPNSGSGMVTILSGHTVTYSSDGLVIDQTVVDAGGVLTINLSNEYYELTINNGSGDDLTVNGTLNLSGALRNEGEGLTGTGKVIINGTCNWNSGHITNTDFNIASGGVMNMEGSGECRINENGIVNNAGTVNFAKTSVAFVMYYNGTFNNLSGGVFEATTNESIYFRSDLSPYNTPVFNNAGTFRKMTGTGTTTIYKMNFNNTGTVDVQSGTLKFTSFVDGTHTGTFTVASGAKILTEDNSDHNFNEGSVINGAGIFEITGGDIFVNGTTNGTVIGPDLTFKLSGISDVVKGEISGAGKLTINGTFEWTSMGNFNTGTIIVAEGGNMNISGDDRKTYYYSNGADLLENYGTITWSGTGDIGGGNKTIRNKSTGVIDIQNNATLDANSGAYTVINDGLIKKSAGTGTSSFRANLTNNGTLQIDTGTLDLYVATLANYDHNSGHPWLNGGVYDLKGKFKFKAQYDVPIEVNNAEIILDGSESGILLYDGSNALINLAAITSPGILTLKNSRDFSSGAAAFTNYGTLNCATNVFSNSGTFLNADYAWLILGSTDGISTSGSTGNIQSSGTRTFHTDGKYHYNGTSAQITGNGLPATVRHLKIENSAGVTLTSGVNATSDLTLSEGALTTNENILTLGTSAGSVGTLTRTNGKIIGNFKRWVAAATANDILFPIGTADNYRPANISFTTAPTTGGTLTTFFTSSNPGTAGLPLSDGEVNIQNVGQDGYWTITPADGFNGGTYDIDLTADGFGGIVDYTKLHLLKRANSSSNWTLPGTHSICSGTNDCPILHRIGLDSFSEFGAGSTSDNPLPVELAYFNGVNTEDGVLLRWETATEVNNYGFEILRSAQNDTTWNNIGFVEGHGNSNSPKQYSYIDENPGSETLSYRLKQIDTDGKFEYSDIVEVEIEGQHPTKFELYQNYPNPFNPTTKIKFTIPTSTHPSPYQGEGVREGLVLLRVYDILGREVATLVNKHLNPGEFEVEFNGEGLSSGVYYYRLKVGNEYQSVKKMLLLK